MATPPCHPKIMDSTASVVAHEEASKLYRHGGEKLGGLWCLAVGPVAGNDRSIDIGTFGTIGHFWGFHKSVAIEHLAVGQRLELFRVRDAATPDVDAVFRLRNRYGALDHSKVWHMVSLAVAGGQLEHAEAVLGATVARLPDGHRVEVWVSRLRADAMHVLRHQLGQIVSMTEGADAWVDYTAHVTPQQQQQQQAPATQLQLQPRQQPLQPLMVAASAEEDAAAAAWPTPPQPVQPLQARARPSHRKSRSTPQPVSQSFIDGEVERRKTDRPRARGDDEAETAVSRRCFATTVPSSVVTTVPPPPRNRDQAAHAFVHHGLLYPPGLSRKQRRSIQFAGRQGHEDPTAPAGVYVGDAMPDGPLEAAAYEACMRAAAAAESDEEGSVGEVSEASDSDAEEAPALRRVLSSSCLLSGTRGRGGGSGDDGSGECGTPLKRGLRRVCSSPMLLSLDGELCESPPDLPLGLASMSSASCWADEMSD